MLDHLVNDQIVDSVADVVMLNTGQAPAQSSAMLDVVMAETVAMAMYNAVNRQQASSMVGSAAVTSACAKMLQTPFPILLPPAPVPVPPSGLQPLPVPPGGFTPAETVLVAKDEAGAAIDALVDRAVGQDAASAVAVLTTLADQIARALATLTPAPAPAPAPPPQRSEEHGASSVDDPVTTGGTVLHERTVVEDRVVETRAHDVIRPYNQAPNDQPTPTTGPLP